MKIFPAIDLLNGNAVRLFKGDYKQCKTYAENPLDVANEFIQSGADCLHVVDLDGAKNGTLQNFDVIKDIAAQCNMFIQVGGGIRTEERIEKYLAIGVNRVILGTAAAQDLGFVKKMVHKYGEAIAVGVDAKDGLVAINGWRETTNVSSMKFCKECAQVGVKTIIYTDISKDGALGGTSLEAYDELANINDIKIVASGGVSFIREIEYLRERGIYAAIVGKAIYEGKLSLIECIKAAKGGNV